MKQINKKSIYTTNRYFPSILLIIFCFLLISCEDAPKNIDEAKKNAIGIWQSTQYGDIWLKIEIKSNGEFSLWNALPNQGNWGDVAKSGTWEVNKTRYSDTGKEYYQATLEVTNGDNFVRWYNLDLSSNKISFEGNSPLRISKSSSNPW
ncbi:MAG: hypothetical protein KFKLKKLM_00692 [Flavobacteriales bacterium]|nr:hypothetical protein [Flavobacteriales bacterium]